MQHTGEGQGLPSPGDTFSRRLREVTAGMTQEQLARELDLDQSYVSRVLRGKVPGRKTARAIVQRWPELRDVVADLMLASA